MLTTCSGHLIVLEQYNCQLHKEITAERDRRLFKKWTQFPEYWVKPRQTSSSVFGVERKWDLDKNMKRTRYHKLSLCLPKHHDMKTHGGVEV
jgi:hypothetical protein